MLAFELFPSAPLLKKYALFDAGRIDDIPERVLLKADQEWDAGRLPVPFDRCLFQFRSAAEAEPLVMICDRTEPDCYELYPAARQAGGAWRVGSGYLVRPSLWEVGPEIKTHALFPRLIGPEVAVHLVAAASVLVMDGAVSRREVHGQAGEPPYVEVNYTARLN